MSTDGVDARRPSRLRAVGDALSWLAVGLILGIVLTAMVLPRFPATAKFLAWVQTRAERVLPGDTHPDAPQWARTAGTARTSFGEIRLGMTRKEFEALIKEWLKDDAYAKAVRDGPGNPLPRRDPYLGVQSASMGFEKDWCDTGIYRLVQHIQRGIGDSGERMTALDIYFERQANTLETYEAFCAALRKKYGEPTRVNKTLLRSYEYRWDWPDEDVRLTFRWDPSAPLLEFRLGVLSKERAAAKRALNSLK